METCAELKARLRDLIGAKNEKRNMAPHCVNVRHASKACGVLMEERKKYGITQGLIRQIGGEMLDMSGPKLHT